MLLPANIRIEYPAPTPTADVTAIVLRLLRIGPMTLQQGGAQSVRSGTLVYLDRRHVLRIRGELALSSTDARRWVPKKVEDEGRYGVHHPHKVWMLLHDDQGTRIANLTPLLDPLHVALELKTPEEAVQRLADVVALVLATGARHGKLLDSGLSNFGEDADGNLYYLDDDIYPWDRFLGLCQGLIHWFRTYPWLSGRRADAFGRRCRELLAAHFPQPITPVTVSNHLRDLPLAEEAQRKALDRFLDQINARPGQAPRQAGRPLPDFVGGGGQPIAILADIHSNLPALEAVLADIEEQGAAAGLVLGDLVGYGPHPEACIDLIRSSGFAVLRGNHDHGVAHGEFAKGFSLMGRRVAEWSSARLDAADKAWLASLPDTLEGKGWMAVHGAPADKRRLQAYVYQLTYTLNLDYLEQRGTPWCFHGHTHREGVWYRGGFCDLRRQTLSGVHAYLVCPGSVGQPRGGRGIQARYALFHPDSREIEVRLVPYDVQRTVRDLEEAGLPVELGERLMKGV